jgi:hypothetical protein
MGFPDKPGGRLLHGLALTEAGSDRRARFRPLVPRLDLLRNSFTLKEEPRDRLVIFLFDAASKTSFLAFVSF